MEKGHGQMRRTRVWAGIEFGELWVMKVGGSWRNEAQIVKVRSKLHKVWQSHGLGWDLRRPEVASGLRDQLLDRRGGHWVREGQQTKGVWSWPPGSRQTGGAGNWTDRTNRPAELTEQPDKLKSDRKSTRLEMKANARPSYVASLRFQDLRER